MKSILFVVYNYSGYSGSAKQAFLLKKYITQYSIKILSMEKRENRGIPEEEDVEYAFSAIEGLKAVYKHRKDGVIIFFGLFPKLMLLSIVMRIKIVMKTTLLGEDDFETLIKKNKIIGKLLISGIGTSIVQNRTIYLINKKEKKETIIIRNGVEIHNERADEKEEGLFIAVGVVCDRKDTLNIIKYYIDKYENKNSRLLLIGPTTICDSKEVDEEYVKLCQKVANGHNVQFLGKKNQIELARIYSKATAIFHFSKREGMPNVLLEAMSYGCIPIVKSMNGIAEEMLGVLGNDLIVDEDNRKKVPETKLKEILASKSIEQLIHKYDMLVVAKEYEEIIGRYTNHSKDRR